MFDASLIYSYRVPFQIGYFVDSGMAGFAVIALDDQLLVNDSGKGGVAGVVVLRCSYPRQSSNYKVR